MAACVRRLPFGLAGIVPPNLLGFAVINLCSATFTPRTGPAAGCPGASETGIRGAPSHTLPL